MPIKNDPKFEFGQLPVFKWEDGTIMSQNNSILRALGSKYGYYPADDPKQLWLCDMMIEALKDLLPHLSAVFQKPTPEECQQALKDMCEKHFPAFLKIADARLQDKVYFTGKLSIADFAVGSFLASTSHNVNNPHYQTFSDVVKGYPNVLKFWENFAQVNSKYLRNRPQYIY